MYAYKFRLIFDDVDGFVRDYEILAKQTFKDFHNVIVGSIAGLENKELASFYICDRKWDKQVEITLIDMNDDEENEDDQRVKKKAIMSKTHLRDVIDDPHQRLIYEYDFLNMKTFYIELLKTFNSTKGISYPRCTASAGEMLKTASVSIENNLEDLLKSNEILDEEDEKDYYDEDDFQSLSNDIEL
ncbi:MAG: plasmid pRiA4b ORF-3 family protein [Bacteroidales bacterium]|jgi:hypothetical protein|nr:plasmid pRiA4b ORF-3 family protein [Bacteroidales bacterium]